MTKNLIFDLDDTLSICHPVYLDVIKEFTMFQFIRTGFPYKFIENIVTAIDTGYTQLPDAFVTHRLSKEFEAVSAALDILKNKPVCETARSNSRYIGDKILHHKYELYPKALDVLNHYRALGYKLFLYTKGEIRLQEKKIYTLKLRQYFGDWHTSWSTIRIVPTKDIPQLTNFIKGHKLDISNTIYVGNSLKDDITPANELGLKTVWINHVDQPQWTAEHCLVAKPTHTIFDISELPQIL